MEEEKLATEAISFIEEIVAYSEKQEEDALLARCDLLVSSIRKLKRKIEQAKRVAEEEIAIVTSWRDEITSKYEQQISRTTEALESFMRERKLKTLNLANGELKIRKSPDKAEVVDLELFLTNAPKETLQIIPEKIKPSLSGIKRWIKATRKMPPGVKLITGEERLIINLKPDKEATQ